jgi:hypothetical protein
LDASENRIDKNQDIINKNDAKIDKLKVEIKEKEGNKSKLY